MSPSDAVNVVVVIELVGMTDVDVVVAADVVVVVVEVVELVGTVVDGADVVVVDVVELVGTVVVGADVDVVVAADVDVVVGADVVVVDVVELVGTVVDVVVAADVDVVELVGTVVDVVVTNLIPASQVMSFSPASNTVEGTLPVIWLASESTESEAASGVLSTYPTGNVVMSKTA